MATEKILVVGGYGAVGRVIATMLAKKFPGRIVVSGRNYERANNLASATNGKIVPLALSSVSMRIGFDSALMTNLMAFLKKIGVFSILRYPWAQGALVSFLMSLQMGSELFVAQVDAQGLVNGEKCASYAVSGETTRMSLLKSRSFRKKAATHPASTQSA